MKKILVMAVGVFGLLSAPAYGTAGLKFTVDGGPSVFCYDGDVMCDSNAAAGAVTFVGALAGGFAVNVTTGLTTPVVLPSGVLMDLLSVNVNSAGGTHDLRIEFSEIGFMSTGGLNAKFGGTLTGDAGSTINGFAAFNPANLAFSGLIAANVGPFGPGAFSGTASGIGPVAGPYSVSAVLDLHSVGLTSFSGDFEISQVPEPASISLLGGALLAAGAVIRRRTQKKAA